MMSRSMLENVSEPFSIVRTRIKKNNDKNGAIQTLFVQHVYESLSPCIMRPVEEPKAVRYETKSAPSYLDSQVYLGLVTILAMYLKRDMAQPTKIYRRYVDCLIAKACL
jgi:hypothetical protein